MQKKSGQKRHHYVPGCYLKAWLDPSAPKTNVNQPYVWLFDKGGVNPRRKSPGNMFHESDMYTLTAPDGRRDLRLEHGLGTIEDKFARIRTSKFAYMRSLTEEEWTWVCLFAAISRTRTQDSRDQLVGTLDQLRNTIDPKQWLGAWRRKADGDGMRRPGAGGGPLARTGGERLQTVGAKRVSCTL